LTCHVTGQEPRKSRSESHYKAIKITPSDAAGNSRRQSGIHHWGAFSFSEGATRGDRQDGTTKSQANYMPSNFNTHRKKLLPSALVLNREGQPTRNVASSRKQMKTNDGKKAKQQKVVQVNSMRANGLAAAVASSSSSSSQPSQPSGCCCKWPTTRS